MNKNSKFINENKITNKINLCHAIIAPNRKLQLRLRWKRLNLKKIIS